MIQRFRIADFVFSLECENDHSPLDGIAKKMQSIRTEENVVPNIRIIYGSKLPQLLHPVTRLEHASVCDGAFVSRTRTGDLYSLSTEDPDSWLVHIAPPKQKFFKKIRHFLKKYLKYNLFYGNTINEIYSKKLLYGIIEPVFLAWMALHGRTLLHCSTVVKDGKAFVFPAWSGVGKTSLLSYFMQAGWDYLCDDIAILSSDGSLHHFPLPMHIYGYHKVACPDIFNRLTAKMKSFDKLIWNWTRKFYAQDKMSRWVTAEHIYGKERIARSATVKNIIHMQRTTIAEPLRFSPASPADLARFVTNTIYNELPLITTISSFCSSHRTKSCIPGLHELSGMIAQNAEQAFSHGKTYEMIIGKETTPAQVWEFLKKEFSEELG